MLNNRGIDIGVYASTEAGFVVSNIKIGDIS